jgi:hypothetical protein
MSREARILANHSSAPFGRCPADFRLIGHPSQSSAAWWYLNALPAIGRVSLPSNFDYHGDLRMFPSNKEIETAGSAGVSSIQAIRGEDFGGRSKTSDAISITMD